MLFFTFDYAVFLSVVLILLVIIPSGRIPLRNCILLLANYFFYCYWDWRFAGLLLFLTSITYFAGLLIGRTIKEKRRRLYLRAVIVLLVLFLGYFKYFNFFITSFAGVVSFTGFRPNVNTLNIILPLGISFYLFICLGYILDVYWEKVKPTKNALQFLAFSSFFPILLSGPVERSTNLLTQLGAERKIKVEAILQGGKLILWGLFKKAVIADNLAGYVQTVFHTPGQYSSPTLMLAAVFFLFQLYADFSGYSDVAIGSAKILGFDLIRNFNLPFLATSFADYWRRWHISLTSWLFDYIFNPLNFSLRKFKKTGMVISLYVTFFISGLWHGADWTYILWGLGHATALNIEVLTRRNWSFRQKEKNTGQFTPGKIARMLLIFPVMVVITVMFRAENVHSAFTYYRGLFGFNRGPLYLGTSNTSLVVTSFAILLLVITQIFQYRGLASLNFSPTRIPVYFRWPGYVMLIITIFIFGKGTADFIYFQF